MSEGGGNDVENSESRGNDSTLLTEELMRNVGKMGTNDSIVMTNGYCWWQSKLAGVIVSNDSDDGDRYWWCKWQL